MVILPIHTVFQVMSPTRRTVKCGSVQRKSKEQRSHFFSSGRWGFDIISGTANSRVVSSDLCLCDCVLLCVCTHVPLVEELTWFFSLQVFWFLTKLRQGIGPDLDSLIARVGAMRVRNTKIICNLKTPSLSSCKQIREAMNAFIENENIKLGPQGTTPFVTEEKPAWRQEQQRTFGKASEWLSNLPR